LGEYEPDDSRIVTNVASEAPGEPPRTGPRENAAREEAQRDEGEKREKESGKPTARDSCLAKLCRAVAEAKRRRPRAWG
jgi:hypothetical protein